MRGGVACNLVNGAHDVLAQRHVAARGRVDVDRVHAETAGLEAVVGIDQVVVFLRHEGLLCQKPGAQRLHEPGQSGGALDGQRGVEDADFNGAEFGLGANVPVEVLHAAHHAGVRHLVEIGLEILPRQRHGRTARERKGKHRIEPRRIKCRVLALDVGARCRERNEVRNEARHAVQHEQGRIGIGAANVHMLAKDGELLGQVAVQIGELAKARLVVDAPLVPLLEWVRAAADHRNVELVGAFDQGIANLRQLPQHFAARMANAGRNLDHAARHLGYHAARKRVLFHQAQHVLSVGRQVVIVGVDELQFQLDPQGERLGMVEGFKTHGCLRRFCAS